MAKYDYSCGTHEWEEERAIADRVRPARCPRCGVAGEFVFHPTANVGVPQSFRTAWADVAPLDANGKPMTFGETVKSGRFDRYRRENVEEAETARAAHEKRMEPVIRKRAQDRAWKRVKAAERTGTRVYTDAQRQAGMALQREAETA